MSEIHTPQCEKLSANAEARSTIDEFLEWLSGQGMAIGHYQDFDWQNGVFTPITVTNDSVVLQFLGIDEQALEQERRALLKVLQDLQEES